MENSAWDKMVLPNNREDQCWELFHENSKLSQFDHFLTQEEILAQMGEFHESLPFIGYPEVKLPQNLSPLNMSLEDALKSRHSARDLSPGPISMETLGTLLQFSYGVTRENKSSKLPRYFRVTPSGGGLFPLEIFFFSKNIQGLKAGVYHYSPSMNNFNFLLEGDRTEEIAKGVVNPSLVQSASVVVFISAIFERSVFKYGDRGYRFIFLEAGHVAQNLNLVSTALDLGSVNIGGFFDRKIDDLLMLDGLTHSTIYMIAIGGKTETSDSGSKSDEPLPKPAL